ncbi:PQQ-dependent sugar dehydrogenase [Variovorax sp. VNK109]|uniref:PQQ-dependent sugar dehydrogenase n=1 Tax=Variovorax sp. VNK109 TaxID=3400919 RepID=UPI003BFADFA6
MKNLNFSQFAVSLLVTISGIAVLPVAAQAVSVRAEVVATGLANPWGVAFLPEGQWLVTEKGGSMRVVGADGRIGEPLQGLPQIAAGGQGGLLDVLADSAFAQNRTVYFCFSEPGMGNQSSANSTALASARLSVDHRRLENVRVIFSQKPKVASRAHFGCRIVESRDGTLFMTLGDRFSRMQDAQTLDNHHGKVIRIRKDGGIPPDNPFVKRGGALPEIWSYGHRNGQGATLAPDGSFWMHEHGPQGGDEINVPQAGRNYGWPVITYGENYGGGKIGDGITSRDGLEQPLHYWAPSIAPSGMAFVTSDRYGPAMKGSLLVGSLKFGYVNRITLAGGKVQGEQKLIADIGDRIRDVKQGPDGFIYVLTDNSRGRLIRLQPS